MEIVHYLFPLDLERFGPFEKKKKVNKMRDYEKYITNFYGVKSQNRFYYIENFMVKIRSNTYYPHKLFEKIFFYNTS